MRDDQDLRMENERPAGCGVQGCLTAAVALFVILLIAMLFIAVIRFSTPPEPRFGAADIVDPATSLDAPAPHV